MRGATHGLELGEDFLVHAEFLKIGAERVDDVVYDSPVYNGLSFVRRISDFVWPAAGIRSNQCPQSARVTKGSSARSYGPYGASEDQLYRCCGGEDILSKTD